MLHKILLAASAAGLIATAAAQPAAAKVNFDVNVGVPGYVVDPYPVYRPYPVYPAYDDGYDDYDEDCGYEYRKIRKWNRYHDAYRIVRKRVWVCH
jgi:hypothetical protein